MTVYQMCERFINAKIYSKAVITQRVNTFYMVGQLTDDQYTELISLIEGKYVA
jgi:hypothetical protein